MFTPEMLASVKKVEATRDARMGMEPRRMTAEEKDALLKAYHPDYREDGFDTIKIGPNKGQKVPKELGHLLHSNSRLLNHPVDLNKIDYDVDVLVIGGGGAGASAAIEAHNAGANVMIVTKLRIGDANTMMAEGGIQALSRSYLGKIIPAERSGEYFGLMDICGKGASFMGTTVVSVVSQITGNISLGVGMIALLFLVGLILFRQASRIPS